MIASALSFIKWATFRPLSRGARRQSAKEADDQIARARFDSAVQAEALNLAPVMASKIVREMQYRLSERWRDELNQKGLSSIANEIFSKIEPTHTVKL